MVEKWSLTYPAYTGEEERSVYVYMPDFAKPKQRFPVLYMFDGHNVFFDEDATYGKSWGLKKYLDEHRIPLMVVAVECNHNPQNARLSEYAPFSFTAARIGQVKGRGQQTMHWFVHTLKPMIDRAYPTKKNRQNTFIAGSSMGGLMSLYGVIAYNHVFSRAAALSPSIWMGVKRFDQFLLNSTIRPDTVIYMDYGEREMKGRSNMLRRFSKVNARLLEMGALVTSRIVPGGEHCEACWEKQIPFLMNTLLYDGQR